MSMNVPLGGASLQNSLKKGISLLSISLLLASMVTFVPVALAAAGEGTATINIGTGADAATAVYGGAAGTGAVTVGTKSYVRIDFTVGASGIVANENNMTVQINANLFPANGWEAAEEAALADLDTVGEWFVEDDIATVYADSAAANTGLITIQGDTAITAGAVISIYAVVNDLNHVLAAADVIILVDDTMADDLTAIAVPITISTVAATLTGGIVLASPAVGAAGNTEITLTVPRVLVNTDTIDITFPAHIDVSGVGVDQVATGTFDDAATLTCNATGQVVTCATDGNTLTTGTIILTGITSSYVATANVAVFEVEALGVAADDIATENGVDIDLTNSTAGTLTTTNVQPNFLYAAYPVTATVTFTNPGSVSIATNDKVVVTFPAGYNLTGVGATSGACASFEGTITTTKVGQVVTLTRGGGGAADAPGDVTCTISGVRNPSTPGSTGAYALAVTTNTGGTEVRYSAAPAADIIGGTAGTQQSSISDDDGSGTSTTTTTTTTTDTTDTTTGETTSTTDTTTTTTDDSGTTTTTTSTGEVETTEPSANTTPFIDVTSHWAADYVSRLYDMDVVEGRTTVSFAPDASITRAEIVKIAMLTFGHEVKEGEKPTFTDVGASDWYASYLAAAQDENIVQGYADGSFHPNEPVNRAEALKIVLSAAGFTLGGSPAAPFTDVMQTAWYAIHVNFAFDHMIVSGKTALKFAPGDSITRAEMSKIAVLAYDVKVEMEEEM